MGIRTTFVKRRKKIDKKRTMIPNDTKAARVHMRGMSTFTTSPRHILPFCWPLSKHRLFVMGSFSVDICKYNLYTSANSICTRMWALQLFLISIQKLKRFENNVNGLAIEMITWDCLLWTINSFLLSHIFSSSYIPNALQVNGISMIFWVFSLQQKCLMLVTITEFYFKYGAFLAKLYCFGIVHIFI